MRSSDIHDALAPVVDWFERAGIPYYLGGSIASSIHGLARATIDVDVVADVKAEDVDSLVVALRSAYYLNEEMIRDALGSRSCFNILHLETMLKVDVFPLGDADFDREVLRRRRRDFLVEEGPVQPFYVASAEDIILKKLEWFHKGGEVSQRQWGDVVGVLRVQGEKLDVEYLRRWAARLGLTDLLERALSS